jgi:hypothetical protein
MTKQEAIRQAANQIAKEMMDQGLLIEAGWSMLRSMTIPSDAPPQQIFEMRRAFFAGAQHLFGSLVGGLDPQKEPTDDDLRRMNMIDAELTKFAHELKLDLETPKANAQ